MGLVLLLQAAQDADRVGDRGLAHEHRLEAPRQRRVLLDVFPILVERGGPDAVQRAARELRLQQVGRVHRAVAPPSPDQGVHLVDEQHDLALRGLDLLQHGLQPLLELAAILGAGHQGAEVQRHQALALQRLRHVAVDDAQRQPLDDRGLADAGLADQHRVVLGAPREHLDHAADLLVAPDHGVELPLARDGRDVPRILLQRVETFLGVGAVDLAAFADVGDGLVDRLRRHARLAQDATGRPGACRERHEQPILRHEAVAGLLRGLLRGVERADDLRRELRLPGAAALDARQLGELRVDRGGGALRIAAGGADQAGRGALLVVEQRSSAGARA